MDFSGTKFLILIPTQDLIKTLKFKAVGIIGELKVLFHARLKGVLCQHEHILTETLLLENNLRELKKRTAIKTEMYIETLISKFYNSLAQKSNIKMQRKRNCTFFLTWYNDIKLRKQCLEEKNTMLVRRLMSTVFRTWFFESKECRVLGKRLMMILYPQLPRWVTHIRQNEMASTMETWKKAVWIHNGRTDHWSIFAAETLKGLRANRTEDILSRKSIFKPTRSKYMLLHFSLLTWIWNAMSIKQNNLARLLPWTNIIFGLPLLVLGRRRMQNSFNSWLISRNVKYERLNMLASKHQFRLWSRSMFCWKSKIEKCRAHQLLVAGFNRMKNFRRKLNVSRSWKKVLVMKVDEGEQRVSRKLRIGLIHWILWFSYSKECALHLKRWCSILSMQKRCKYIANWKTRVRYLSQALPKFRRIRTNSYLRVLFVDWKCRFLRFNANSLKMQKILKRRFRKVCLHVFTLWVEAFMKVKSLNYIVASLKKRSDLRKMKIVLLGWFDVLKHTKLNLALVKRSVCNQHHRLIFFSFSLWSSERTKNRKVTTLVLVDGGKYSKFLKDFLSSYSLGLLLSRTSRHILNQALHCWKESFVSSNALACFQIDLILERLKRFSLRCLHRFSRQKVFLRCLQRKCQKRRVFCVLHSILSGWKRIAAKYRIATKVSIARSDKCRNNVAIAVLVLWQRTAFQSLRLKAVLEDGFKMRDFSSKKFAFLSWSRLCHSLRFPKERLMSWGHRFFFVRWRDNYLDNIYYRQLIFGVRAGYFSLVREFLFPRATFSFLSAKECSGLSSVEHISRIKLQDKFEIMMHFLVHSKMRCLNLLKIWCSIVKRSRFLKKISKFIQNLDSKFYLFDSFSLWKKSSDCSIQTEAQANQERQIDGVRFILCSMVHKYSHLAGNLVTKPVTQT